MGGAHDDEQGRGVIPAEGSLAQPSAHLQVPPDDFLHPKQVSRDAGHHAELAVEIAGPPATSRREVSRVGRPSKSAPFAERVRLWLADEPELSTRQLLRRAKEHAFSGSKTAFYELVARLRIAPRTAPWLTDSLPGEISQHDVGRVDLTFGDGSNRRLSFFASRLKYSRYVAVTLVHDERVETLVRCLARDFVKFGGLPLLAVFDRPISIVDTWRKSGQAASLDAAFAQAIVDLGVGVELCAPRSRKRSPERIAKWVKESFFEPDQFRDVEALQLALEAWHVDVNWRCPSRATAEIPEIRRRREQVRLRPIKFVPDELALRIAIVVGPAGDVWFEGVKYALSSEAMHLPGTLFLYEHRLRIVAGRFEVEHQRRQ